MLCACSEKREIGTLALFCPYGDCQEHVIGTLSVKGGQLCVQGAGRHLGKVLHRFAVVTSAAGGAMSQETLVGEAPPRLDSGNVAGLAVKGGKLKPFPAHQLLTLARDGSEILRAELET